MSDRKTLIVDVQSRLSDWTSVDDFSKTRREIDDKLGGLAALRSNGSAKLGFWRDAWVAETYAKLTNASAVRLVTSQRPDFELQYRDDIKAFEATEIDRPGRRRGDEFEASLLAKAAGLCDIADDPPENWLTPKTAEAALKAASQSKANKPYPAECGLVIYLNWSFYAFDNFEARAIECVMSSATSVAASAFCTVDILWQSRLYRVWNNGKALF